MKCGFGDCDREAIGEAYFPGIDKWHPLCTLHYASHAKGGMKVRLLDGQVSGWSFDYFIEGGSKEQIERIIKKFVRSVEDENLTCGGGSSQISDGIEDSDQKVNK